VESDAPLEWGGLGRPQDGRGLGAVPLSQARARGRWDRESSKGEGYLIPQCLIRNQCNIEIIAFSPFGFVRPKCRKRGEVFLVRQGTNDGGSELSRRNEFSDPLNSFDPDSSPAGLGGAFFWGRPRLQGAPRYIPLPRAKQML
jgi:hypothetical protein